MSSTQFILTIIFALLALFGTVQPVAADAGDVIGGLLGGVIGFVVICGLCGWWARRQGGGTKQYGEGA